MSSTEALSPVTVSANAARRIKEILSSEPAGAHLRVSVEGGGCSGFRYEFAVDTVLQDEDLAVERDGIRVVVDPVSLEYMNGSEIDFVDELIGASFQIKNPNATSGCGCGTSFSV
jgi:iron-sulfur cluster assembly accessory protein